MPNQPPRFGDLPLTVIEKQTTCSTNTDCKALLTEHPPVSPVLILADRQTGGRGRQGKTFLSPPGGLYMSLLLPLRLPYNLSVKLTTASSVAVCRALQKELALSCEVKWVNDLYVRGRKLAGILTEAVNDYTKGQTEYVIVGIGINLTDAPPEVNATCVADCLPHQGPIDKKRLAVCVTAELFEVFTELLAGGSAYMEEYRRRSCVLNHWVRCTRAGEIIEGKAVSIDNDGGLTLCLPDGTSLTLTSGEITLRIAESGPEP